MAYAEYNYYAEVYAGREIAEEEFPWLSARASEWIDYITAGAAAAHGEQERVKLACCAVAEAWQIQEDGGPVVSQSVGSWSRTYAPGAAQTRGQALTGAARMYIGPLLREVAWA